MGYGGTSAKGFFRRNLSDQPRKMWHCAVGIAQCRFGRGFQCVCRDLACCKLFQGNELEGTVCDPVAIHERLVKLESLCLPDGLAKSGRRKMEQGVNPTGPIGYNEKYLAARVEGNFHWSAVF